MSEYLGKSGFQLLFQDIEGQPEGKPFPAVLEIYAGDFPDALQTVEEGAAVNVQLLCGLQNIAFQLQIDLGGMVQVCFVVIVVFFQEKQFFQSREAGAGFPPCLFSGDIPAGTSDRSS